HDIKTKHNKEQHCYIEKEKKEKRKEKEKKEEKSHSLLLRSFDFKATALSQMNWTKYGRSCFSKITDPHVYGLLGLQQNVARNYNNNIPIIVCRLFGSGVGRGNEADHQLSREFLVKLWAADRKMGKHPIEKQRMRLLDGDRRGFFNSSVAEDSGVKRRGKKLLKQPPISQSVSEVLKAESPEEAKLAPLVARSNLLITRDIEWANLVFGFEQENRYAIVDPCYPKSPVGFIREQSNVLARQFLRLRRPFIAYITDGLGNELFRVRRPFWWITSSIYAEIDGKEVGVVHQRWHLWRRIYDLYLGNKQFAVVENPGLWNWTFTLKDINGEVLAQIDRDWRGFGFELLTDAGQYVIRFGISDPDLKIGRASKMEELEVIRPLTLAERAVAVALAISLDNDFFSRHGGWGLPFFVATE
ncbi:hypothetical protein S83_045920, partial [Arachis hypogaea]